METGHSRDTQYKYEPEDKHDRAPLMQPLEKSPNALKKLKVETNNFDHTHQNKEQ